MSIALKRKQFQVSIRRQNLSKILHHKKLNLYAQLNANQALEQFMSQESYPRFVPQICVRKLEFIMEGKLFLLIQMIKQNKVKINVSRPQDIAMINKLALIDPELITKYVQEATDLAHKTLYTLGGNQIWRKKNQDSSELLGQLHLNNQKYQQKLVQPPQSLMRSLERLPNCLLELWSKFFQYSSESEGIAIDTYCTIMIAFEHWFSEKSLQKKNYSFSKYSVCCFLRNFFKYQNSFYSEYIVNKGKTLLLHKQTEELHIKMRLVSMPLILRFMEEGFFCEQLVEVLIKFSNSQSLRNSLFRAMRQNQLPRNLFNLLLEGLNNQNIFINPHNNLSSRFINSQNLSDEDLVELSELSTESMTLMKNVEQKIWKCKIKILEVFNSMLNGEEYPNVLYSSDIEAILQTIFRTYIYCTQRGSVTSQVQKTICVILYNLVLLVQNLDELGRESPTCLYIITEDHQKIEERFRDYWIRNVGHLAEIVEKTSYDSYDHMIQLIATLNLISQFIDRKQVDEQIMFEANLVCRVLDSLEQSDICHEAKGKVVESLFQYLDHLFSKEGFDFRPIFHQMIRFKSFTFEEILTQTQQELVELIVKPLMDFPSENEFE